MVALRPRQQGLTYFWFLLVVFLLSLVVGRYLDAQSSLVRRQKEAELIRVGELYREAISQYYLSSPNGVYRYPDRLEDLVRDPRHVVVRRYIRQLYPDPITGQPFERISAEDGGVSGVRSTSLSRPLAAHSPGTAISVLSDTYREWTFVYRPH